MSKRVSKTNKLGDKIKKEKVNKKDEELVLSDISEDEEIVIEVEKPKKNKNTKETGTQDINKYQKLDHVDQILTRSETYIGSTNNDEEQEIFILKSTSDIIVENENVFNGYKIIKKNINYSEGFIKIFAEVMCNAIDNVWNSIQNGVKTNFIKFYINKETNTFTIFNDGLNISTKNHPKENIPLPEMIFGVLLTSSNYNDNEERMTSGRNGYGIKLTNIFSTSFEVEIYNKEEGILYTQLWENNMKKKNTPILSKKGFPKSIEEGKNGYTKITWKPDMNRFNLKNISDDLFAVFEKFILDTAMAVGLLNNTKVMYNDKRIEIKDIQQYVNYYFEELPEEKIVISTENSKIFLFCINDPVQVSFVNGNYTKYGGTHVDAWCEAIFKPILEKLNKKLEKKKVSLTIKDIKKYFFIFIFCNIDKPEFDGQTKDKLTKPKKEEIKAIIKPSELNKILKWSFIEKINESLQVKEMLELKKTERKRGRVKVEGLDDANFSGKNGKSQDCILCLTEGSSARTYVVEGMKYGLFDKKGSDYIGVLPIRGKFLNAKNASISTLTNNKEVNSLIQSLGLQYNVDYTLQENFKKLRYGRLLACVDSDVDGSHITSLLYNFFHTLYPSLLNVKGFFSFMRTPIIKIIHKNSELVFYHYEQAKKYIQINQPKNIKYFKGLATSKNNDIKNDFGKCIVNIEKNEETDELMKNIFHKDFSDYRKEWLLNYKPKEYNNDTLDQKNFIIKNTIIEDINSSDFINNELILFSLDDCKRSIPNMCDGLKESQRKVLFAAFKKGLKYEKESIKVAQLSGFVSEHTNYHHGEDNLHETIIRLAQRYVGSNNIPLFYDDGQFGCLSPDTLILLWNGCIKKAEEIQINDILIGDDGEKRIVNKITSGIDEMYEIKLVNGEKYNVNSKHILTLYFSQNNKINWKNDSNSWYILYFDGSNIKQTSITTKNTNTTIEDHFNKTKYTKEEAYELIKKKQQEIFDLYNTNEIIDIKLEDYLKLSKTNKKFLYSISNVSSINWDKKDVPIDPYILGAWLGDGNHDGTGITSKDEEIIKEFALYADKINCELTHDKNGENHENYHYHIRRKTSGYKTSIGDINHNSSVCNGCLSSKHKLTICDWHFEKTPLKINYSENIDGVKRNDMNPFINILKDNALFKNKHIPRQYLINDKNTRLELLAGFIDTDGTVKTNSGNDIYQQYIEISQTKRLHNNLIIELEFLCKSLGFSTSISEVYQGKTKKNEDIIIKTLRIFGKNIYEIPTRLLRKKISNNDEYRNKPYHNYFKFSVTSLGKNKFCGWSIDKNERFLLNNFIVTHNSRLENGKDAGNGRYIFTKCDLLTRYIFREEDENYIKNREEDGDIIEKEVYYPIIPTILLNGCSAGIGTGFSCSVPNYNLEDLITYIKNWLNGKENIKLLPNYKGFNGKIELQNNKIISYGVFEHIKNNVYKITEIPLGKNNYSITKYKEKLHDLEDKDVLKLMRYDLDSRLINFEISWNGENPPTYEDLFLVDTMHTSNMVLFNSENKLQKYNNIDEIMEDFCNTRFNFYKIRKDGIIKNIELEIPVLENKIKFINEILNNTIDLKNNEDCTLIHLLENKKYYKHENNYNYLLNINIRSMTKNKIKELENELNEKKNNLENYKKLTIKQIWTQELDELLKKYNEWDNTQINTLENKLKEKTKSKKGKN